MMTARDNRILRLTAEELARIRPLGAQFAEEVKLFGGFVPEHFESQWQPLMENDQAVVFYTQDPQGKVDSFLGASYLPDLYCGWPAAQMQFFYLDPPRRSGSTAVRLFREFILEAKRRGTRKYFVGRKVGINEEGMNNLFNRHGFVPGEVLFWRNE